MYVLSLLRMPLQTSRFLAYKKFGATSIASVRISAAQQLFWFADPEAIKLVASDRHTFQKDIVSYEMINIYGGNVVSVEGSNWKRHRSVAMSAFNEASSLSLDQFTIICLTWVQGKRCADLVGNSACDK
jgi:cytochrome P450